MATSTAVVAMYCRALFVDLSVSEEKILSFRVLYTLLFRRARDKNNWSVYLKKGLNSWLELASWSELGSRLSTPVP